MEAAEAIDICRQAMYVLVIISAPAMIVSLVVGLIVSLFQALTQIQEMTLTFVPKVLAMFAVLALCMPFMLNTLIDFTHKLQDRMEHVE